MINVYRRRAFITFLLVFIFVSYGFSQNYRIEERTRLYTEVFSGDSLLLKADNSFPIPLSLKLNLSLVNLEGGAGMEIVDVLQAGASGQVVGRFRIINPQADYKCSYQWKLVLGDVLKTPDEKVLYAYPFKAQDAYPISQGPGDAYTHQRSFAYDFLMPAGTLIAAAREGVVAFVNTEFEIGGPQKELIDKVNVISVMHSDGTIANYGHLKKNGSLVKEGDSVRKGQFLGFSGNTGYTTGPHLHFEVVRPSLDSNDKKWVKFEWEQSVLSAD